MADIFRTQEWDISDPQQTVSLADINSETLADAITNWDLNPVPANNQRSIIYRYDGETGFRTYQHSAPIKDRTDSVKGELKKQFFNGFALEFNGIDEYIDFGDNYDFDIDQAFTVSFWMKDNKQGAMQGIFGKKDGTYGTGWACGIFPDNQICFVIRSTPYIVSPLDIGSAVFIKGSYVVPQDTWGHFVFTKEATTDANDMKIYINGVLLDKTIVQDNLSGSSQTSHNLRMGLADDNTSGFEGQLTQAFIASGKSCTPAHVLELYNGGTPLDLANFTAFADLSSWWELGNNTTLPNIPDKKGSIGGTSNKVLARITAGLPRSRSIRSRFR